MQINLILELSLGISNIHQQQHAEGNTQPMDVTHSSKSHSRPRSNSNLIDVFSSLNQSTSSTSYDPYDNSSYLCDSSFGNDFYHQSEHLTGRHEDFSHGTSRSNVISDNRYIHNSTHMSHSQNVEFTGGQEYVYRSAGNDARCQKTSDSGECDRGPVHDDRYVHHEHSPDRCSGPGHDGQHCNKSGSGEHDRGPVHDDHYVMMADIIAKVAVVNMTEAQCMMTIMYIMNTVLTDIQVQVMMANIITKVAVMKVTEAQCMMTIMYVVNTVLTDIHLNIGTREPMIIMYNMQGHLKIGAQAMIIMYIVNTVHPTMNSIVQGITVMLGLGVLIITVHFIMVLMVKIDNLNPVMFLMYIMMTVWPTIKTITPVSHITKSYLRRFPSPAEKRDSRTRDHYVCHEQSPNYYEDHRSRSYGSGNSPDDQSCYVKRSPPTSTKMDPHSPPLHKKPHDKPRQPTEHSPIDCLIKHPSCQHYDHEHAQSPDGQNPTAVKENIKKTVPEPKKVFDIFKKGY